MCGVRARFPRPERPFPEPERVPDTATRGCLESSLILRLIFSGTPFYPPCVVTQCFSVNVLSISVNSNDYIHLEMIYVIIRKLKNYFVSLKKTPHVRFDRTKVSRNSYKTQTRFA